MSAPLKTRRERSMFTKEAFKKRMEQLVGESDYSRTELKKNMNVNSSSFYNALVHGVVPTPKTLVKIADYFGVSLLYLLGETNENDFLEPFSRSTFAERFKGLCEENGVTAYRVSTALGFDNSLIIRWLKKGYIPSLEILMLLTDYFGVSPDYLLGRTDYKH